jgi:VanZ family protein
MAIAWTITIVILSLLSPGKIPNVITLSWDKLLHFGAYFLLMYLLIAAFYNHEFRFKRSLLLLTIVLGIGIEFIQKFMDLGRSLDYMDMIANMMGSWIGFHSFDVYLKLKTWILH